MIRSGKDPQTGGDMRNFAHRILQSILDGQEEFVELDDTEEASEAQAAKEAILQRVAEARAQVEGEV
jgi:hypothetical protein